MAEAFANSEDLDQMPCSAASDLGLHSLPITLLGVSQIQWDKQPLTSWLTILTLSIGTPNPFTILVLKFEIVHSTTS